MRIYRQHYKNNALMDSRRYHKIYVEHVGHMTGEDLHGKAEIAHELAIRDHQIGILQSKLKAACELVDVELKTELEARLNDAAL